jgi:hypothetical protein
MTAPHFDASSQAFASQAFASEDRLFPATAPEDSSAVRYNRIPADQLLLPVFSSPNEVRGPTHPHPFVEDSAFESSKGATANQLTSPDPYQPLIAATQQPVPRLQPRESPPTSTAARTSEAARRSQPAQRDADEIHIHIGRIEVAAIAQPAPRPAAAAARRSLNLDEYLRHGNGRPG